MCVWHLIFQSKGPEVKLSFIRWVFHVTWSLRALLILKQPWLSFGEKKIHFGKVYSVANLKPVCNCSYCPLKPVCIKMRRFSFFLCVILLNSQLFSWNLCLSVCFQGGYAAYRYAQPTAATAAAYSDRYDSKHLNPFVFPLFTQLLFLFFSVLFAAESEYNYFKQAAWPKYCLKNKTMNHITMLITW